jgi:hypothetical protein
VGQGVDGLGDPEVEDLARAGLGDDHVLRREIPVHDLQGPTIGATQLVGVVQPIEDLAQHLDLHCPGDPLLDHTGGPAQAVQGGPVQVLHGDEVRAGVLPDFVGLDDVRMAEAAGDARLVEKHRHVLRIVQIAQPLDHVQLLVAAWPVGGGQVNVGHPAAPQLRQQSIPPQHQWSISVHHRETPPSLSHSHLPPHMRVRPYTACPVNRSRCATPA